MVPGIGKPLGLMPPRHDDDEELSPREDGDHAPRGPSPRWRASSYDSYDGDYEVEDNDDPDDAYHGWEIHEAYVKEDEARRHHGGGRVEAVKFFSTSGRTSRKRSPGSSNNMTNTFEETTSHTKRMKKVTFCNTPKFQNKEENQISPFSKILEQTKTCIIQNNFQSVHE